MILSFRNSPGFRHSRSPSSTSTRSRLPIDRKCAAPSKAGASPAGVRPAGVSPAGFGAGANPPFEREPDDRRFELELSAATTASEALSRQDDRHLTADNRARVQAAADTPESDTAALPQHRNTQRANEKRAVWARQVREAAQQRAHRVRLHAGPCACTRTITRASATSFCRRAGLTPGRLVRCMCILRLGVFTVHGAFTHGRGAPRFWYSILRAPRSSSHWLLGRSVQHDVPVGVERSVLGLIRLRAALPLSAVAGIAIGVLR